MGSTPYQSSVHSGSLSSNPHWRNRFRLHLCAARIKMAKALVYFSLSLSFHIARNAFQHPFSSWSNDLLPRVFSWPDHCGRSLSTGGAVRSSSDAERTSDEQEKFVDRLIHRCNFSRGRSFDEPDFFQRLNGIHLAMKIRCFQRATKLSARSMQHHP